MVFVLRHFFFFFFFFAVVIVMMISTCSLQKNNTTLTVTSLVSVRYLIALDIFSPIRSCLINCIIFIMFGSLSNQNSFLSSSNVRLQSTRDDAASCQTPRRVWKKVKNFETN